MIRNKRKFERNEPSDKHCIVHLGGGACEGTVINESEEGIRIGNLDLLILFANQLLTIETETRTIFGCCRTVSRDPNGSFQVGVLSTSEPLDQDSDSILISSFSQLGENKLACIPIGFDQETIHIRFLDDEESFVEHDQISQLTRRERLEELCSPEILKQALKAYHKKETGNEFADRTTILTHEFGPVVKPYAAAE